MVKMASIIEFNGRKYDSLTGKALSSAKSTFEQIDIKKVFKPEPAKSIDGVSAEVRKIAIKTDFDETKPPVSKPAAAGRKLVERKRRAEKPKTLMRSSVKKPRHKPDPEHKPPARVGLYKELRRERARRARHMPKSTSIAKFSKAAAARKPQTVFKKESLPVALPPVSSSISEAVSTVSSQTHHLAGKLEQAVQSAESHLEVLADDKLKSRKSRRLAYALASFTSVFLIGFAVYQAVPFVQVKMASSKAGFNASLPDYAPSGYGLENNLESENGMVTMTYSAEENSKKYMITQMPSQWNSDSLLNSYVLPTGSQFKRIDENGQTVYLYNEERSATWLDNGIWYRLDGANNFSDDQLLRIVQGL